MANALYPSFKKLLLDGDIDLLTDTVKAVIIDTADYTYNAAHDFLDDVPAAARVGTTAALASKTTTAGAFDSDNPIASAVSGDISEAVILFKDTGDAATSPLMVYIDTGVTGLPVTPNGGDITLAWDTYIFTL